MHKWLVIDFEADNVVLVLMVMSAICPVGVSAIVLHAAIEFAMVLYVAAV